MAAIVPFFSAVSAGAAGTGIAASSFVGPLTAIQSAGVAVGSVGATIASVGGLASTVLGTLQQGAAQEQALAMNAQMQRYNAQIQERDAQLAKRSSEIAASDARKETLRRLATARSIQTKSGVVTTAGSPLLVQQEILAEGILESKKMLYEGVLSQQASLAGAQVSRVQAASYTNAAKSVADLTATKVGGTLLTGGMETLSTARRSYGVLSGSYGRLYS